MARLACWVSAGSAAGFRPRGKWIFKFLGITMPAFQLAASIVLLLVALDMLRAQRSRVQETSEETAAGAEKTDIAVTPLAIPMLAGPGQSRRPSCCITGSQPGSTRRPVSVYRAVCLASYPSPPFGARRRWLSPIAMNITARIWVCSWRPWRFSSPSTRSDN